MREENNFYDESMENNEMAYFEFEGNRFLIDRGVLKDVQVESATVRVPESVKEIRRQAFLDARLMGRMETLFVPATVRKIERLTFAGMPRLRRVELQAAIVTLEQGMFRNCMELERVLLPNTLRKIESRAFENCIQLKEVVLPGVWVQISEDAFQKCINLKDRRIEKAIAEAVYKRKKEEEEARKARFPHLNVTEKEALPEKAKPEQPPEATALNEKSVAEELLEAELLSERTMEKETEEAHFCIHDGVLERCEVYGRSITIPEGVTALGDRVLYGMEQLEEIVFPTTLSYIGAQALEGTAWLAKEREKSSYVVVNGILVSAFYNSMVMEAKLPDHIYRIAPYAFYQSEAQLVVLPESIRKVDARAFVESGVTEIDFSPRADVIFQAPVAVRCNKLRELYFQGKVDRLEENFVEDCPDLKRVCLKWSQTVISKEAFPENVRIWVI